MELKHVEESYVFSFPALLIVLNGIETETAKYDTWYPSFSFNRTKWNWNIPEFDKIGMEEVLLIVLNGIETIGSCNILGIRLIF